MRLGYGYRPLLLHDSRKCKLLTHLMETKPTLAGVSSVKICFKKNSTADITNRVLYFFGISNTV